jgi:hypothetical protein
MNIAEYDQTLAEANQTLDDFVRHFRLLASENGPGGEAANLTMLAEALEPTPSTALAVLVAAAVRRLAMEGGDSEGTTCPRCGLKCSRDEVHNGVAMLYGPWGCACGWSESERYDLTSGPKTEGSYDVDQWGGLTPGEPSP